MGDNVLREQFARSPYAVSLYSAGRAGTVNFADVVFKELSSAELQRRMSHHLPLWVEFGIPRV